MDRRHERRRRTCLGAAHCGPDLAPLFLQIPDRLGEILFSDFATLEIRLDDALRARVPSADGVVTQADFARIIDAIRAEARLEFGPQADRRER